MKRDLDLIRKLLLTIESGEESDLSEYPPEVCNYHRALLIEAGLAVGHIHERSNGMPDAVLVQRLTWEGHEYLDAIRSEDIWARTKRTFKNQGVAMTFDLVKTVAIKLATDLLFR